MLYRGMIEEASGERREALLRGAVAVLYAHWEGSIKASARLYVDYVQQRGLALGELAVSFMAMAMRRQIHSLAESTKARIHSEIIGWLFAELPNRARLPKRGVVRAQSNLSVTVFQNLVTLVGLEYRAEYALSERPIIERVLQLRNGIAHGEWQRIDESEFNQLYHEIDKLMVLFCEDIETAAAGRRFRRSEALVMR